MRKFKGDEDESYICTLTGRFLTNVDRYQEAPKACLLNKFIAIEEVKKIIDECDGILCKWVNLDRISWNVAHYEFLKNLKKRLEK